MPNIKVYAVVAIALNDPAFFLGQRPMHRCGRKKVFTRTSEVPNFWNKLHDAMSFTSSGSLAFGDKEYFFKLCNLVRDKIMLFER